MSQQQQGGSNDDTMMLAIFASMGALMLAMWLLRANEPLINAILGALAWVHVAPFAAASRWLLELPQLPRIGFLHDTILVDRFLSETSYAYMSAEQRSDILSVAGRCASIVYAPALTALLFGTKFRPDQIYREKPTLNSMIAFQSRHWKTIRPIRDVNPAKLPDVTLKSVADTIGKRRNGLPGGQLVLQPEATAYRAPEWARGLRPEEWLVAQGLTHDQQAWLDASRSDEALTEESLGLPQRHVELTLEGAIELLSAQLTRPWTGFDDLKPFERCLCAVFALFYNYENSKGERILNELAVLFAARGGRDFNSMILAEKALHDRVTKTLNGKPGKQLAKVAGNHAWVQTAMVRMLTVARKDRGVLAAAQFNWLKVQDRSLWYALSSTGRDAFMIEAAGVLAHFKAEMQIGAPLRRPAVYQAARSLIEDYLDLRPERVERRARKAEENKNVATRFQEAVAASRADMEAKP